MQIPRVDPRNASGLIDKVIGLGKEVVGTLGNRERLAKAGRVQQQKGAEKLKAVQSQIQADAHEAQAAAAEQSQRAAQATKEQVHN